MEDMSYRWIGCAFKAAKPTTTTASSSSRYRTAANSMSLTMTIDGKATIYCLLLFCAIAFALPHQPKLDQERDAVTDINSPEVNRQPPLSRQHHHHENVTQIANDDLRTSSTVHNNQSSLSATTSSTSDSAAGRQSTGAREPTIGADLIDDYDDSFVDNTTLLIDYNQQSYRSSSEAPVTLVAAGESPPEIATIVAPVALSLVHENQTTRDRDDHDDSSESIALGTESDSRASSNDDTRGEMRAKPQQDPGQVRDLRDARIGDKLKVNTSEIFATLFKKKPYSKYWSVEQKWDDIFKRFMAIQGTVKALMMKNFLRDIEYYADVSISQKCADDLRYIQNYTAKSTNMRWLTHMFDSTGKSESGMLTGNLANLGHVVQCIKVRAPARPSNDTFNERYFEQQAAKLGERFRGKYCLASLRPVMPERPRLISRFSEILNTGLLSNISYMGEPASILKQRALETTVPDSLHESIDRLHNRLDQIPFESELYEYLILARNFGYSLPRFMGVCYPSSCSKDDIRYSIQKSVDDQHQVVDIEYECELEESDAWEWFTTPRLVIYLLLALVASLSFGASFVRHILVDRLQLKRQLAAGCNNKQGQTGSKLANMIATLDLLSMDKCAGILLVKTKPASPIVDKDRVENNRSTAIDALKGFLMLMLIYSELVHLGCLPVPFMWAKWSDAMFPFFRSYVTQIFLNTSVWSEAFYLISAYLISLKLLENFRPQLSSSSLKQTDEEDRRRIPRLSGFLIKRYIRLSLPMIAFMLISYVWPRLSNGFVMQDQASKILAPCDDHGWTNMLLFHNYNSLNETCLWPTHVSASFFQLHLLSYPILVLLMFSLRTTAAAAGASNKWDNKSRLLQSLMAGAALGAMIVLASIGLVYSALRASGEEIIVPFLIDYIDFDNYQRVIEWTVMPTHNHLASYMAGILLAYMVVKSRMAQQSEAAQRKNWQSSSAAGGGAYMQREGSLDSVVSSSTQELNLKPTFMFSHHADSDNRRMGVAAAASTRSASSVSQCSSSSPIEGSILRRNCLYQVSLELALVLVMLASITASFYWNGLGQPMSPTQTFWYMIGTKLAFILAFGCFFYRHFATRRNSSNPWMITRFLVPVGRMSLMLFYMSWPVIWFDLLASLYQWHPSHYFLFEKYNEIAFMSLVLSMFTYGAFEGTVKIIQYQSRTARLKQQQQPPTATDSQRVTRAGFEYMFQPIDWDEQQLPSARTIQADKSAGSDNQMFSKSSSAAAGSLDATAGEHKTAVSQVTGLSVPSGAHFKTKGSSTAAAAAARKRLSIADQYKLNAELRANYSFASIGLYESAGATDDLPSANQQTGDPQVSPGKQRQ